MPPYATERFTTHRNNEIMLGVFPSEGKSSDTLSASVKLIPQTDNGFVSTGKKLELCISNSSTDSVARAIDGGDKMPRDQGLEDCLNAQNIELNNIEICIQTLRWQLSAAEEKISKLSEECQNMQHRSNTLKEEKRVLLNERGQVWKTVDEDKLQKKISTLVKEQSDLNIEQALLRKEERNHALSHGTMTLKLVIFSVGIMYLI